MSGTDLERSIEDPSGPTIVLVEPQLGENIGMAARAMLNCGLVNLRLVNPREPWPNAKAVAAASGADRVLERATVHPTTADAVADLSHVYATTARPRYMTKRILTGSEAVAEMRRATAPVGILFGKEARGLHNDDVALADTIISVPLNPGFSSLNIAMAVLLVGHAWFLSNDQTAGERLAMPKETRLATKEELLGLFEHLEAELDRCGFLRDLDKRPIMVRNLRNLLGRAHLTEQEVRTLRGVITCLVFGGPAKGRRSDPFRQPDGGA